MPEPEKKEETSAEKQDIRLSPILKSGIVLVVVAAILHVVVWFMYGFLVKHHAKADPGRVPLAPQERVLPPDPRLQVTPVRDLSDLRKKEEATLNGYGWVDKEKGVVRIPVSRAMQLLVEREGTMKTEEDRGSKIEDRGNENSRP